MERAKVHRLRSRKREVQRLTERKAGRKEDRLGKYEADNEGKDCEERILPERKDCEIGNAGKKAKTVRKGGR